MSKTLPPIQYETLPWRSSFGERYLTGKNILWIKNHSTYRAAIPNKIASLQIEIPSDIQTKIDDALAIMTRFDENMSHRNFSLPQIMLRSESASSSQIENLTASSRNIAWAELDEKAPENSKIIANNIAAMKQAIDEADHLTINSIVDIHRALLPELDGQIRTEQVWIGGSNLGPAEADFVPPKHQRVAELLDDLIQFNARDDINPIVKAAILHAQFETIHPFIDGNGRTGRALIHVVLRSEMILRHTALPISAGLLHNIQNYFKALAAYHDGDYLKITEELCDAIFEAVKLGGAMIQNIEKITDDWRSRIVARKDAKIWQLLDILIEQPVLNADYVKDYLRISRRAAYNAIEMAAELKIVHKVGNEVRDVYYEASDITRMLDLVCSDDGLRRVSAG
jgi:Fic family protein